jgi:hypothetical protein
MKQIILSLIILSIACLCYSQANSDSIEVKQRLGKVYLQNGKVLSSKGLNSLLDQDEKSSLELKKAKANLAPMYLFSFSGGFLIGWPLGTALGGGKPQWLLAAGGVGLILCAIPFQIGYNKHLYKAVTIYNSRLKKIGLKQTIMEFGFAKNGCGIEIRF